MAPTGAVPHPVLTAVKPDEVFYRLLQRLPNRMLSLRTIVITAALSVVILVLTLGTWVWIGVTNDQYSQLDRRWIR